jgi:hypothetical protein
MMSAGSRSEPDAIANDLEIAAKNAAAKLRLGLRSSGKKLRLGLRSSGKMG